jgi:hypothetical protein
VSTSRVSFAQRAVVKETWSLYSPQLVHVIPTVFMGSIVAAVLRLSWLLSFL